jgi:hypothetical protein
MRRVVRGEVLRQRAWDLIEGQAMRPSVGRDVHYVSAGSPVLPDGSQQYPSTCRAAKITEVDEGNPERIGVMVINPTGVHFHSLGQGGVKPVGGGCINDEPYPALVPGSWHWPAYVQ